MALAVGAVQRAPTRTRLQAALYAAPVAVLATLGWTHRNVLDDGFIYLRIVHNVTGGHGPVFNVGERVEAFTSPMWLGILSVADLITPVRLEWLAVVLGIGATLGGIALAMAGSARLVRQTDPDALLVPFGAIVIVALAPMWSYASSGLETGITFLWVGACVWALAGWSMTNERLDRRGVVLLGLGWLIRPELVVMSIVFLSVVLALQWRRDTWPQRTRFALLAVALPAAYQVFRMGYYGSLVANTALAKEGTHIRWARGWEYFLNFVEPYWFVVPLVLILVAGYWPLFRSFRAGAASRAVCVLAAILGAGVVVGVYVIAVGGDYEHARLLLPAVFAICAPVAVVPARRRHLVAVGLAPWLIAAAFVMRPPPFVLGTSFLTPPDGRVTTNDQEWGGGSSQLAAIGDSGLYYQELPRLKFYAADNADQLRSSVHQPAAPIFAVGLMPYAVGERLYILDLFGLADAFTAHLKSPEVTGLIPYPGHEKPLPQPWIVARLFPDGVYVDPADIPGPGRFLPSLIPRLKGRAFDRQVDVARAALDCAPIRRLERSVSAPMSVGRFFHNILDSIANTRLRIPPDPDEAYRKLCGGDPPRASGAQVLEGRGSAHATTTSAPEIGGMTAGSMLVSDRPRRGGSWSRVTALSGYV